MVILLITQPKNHLLNKVCLHLVRIFLFFSDDKILKSKPDYALLLAWNFSKEIIKNNIKYLKKGGKFIIPLPNVKIIGNKK